MNRRACLPVISIALSISLALSMFGQGGVTGAIGGHVTDPAEAAVAGASVTVTNTNTGVSYTVATTSDGYYVVKFLIPGTYSVAAAQQGFQRTVATGITVEAASNPTVNLKLTIGTISETITVKDTSAMVEAQTADRGAVIDSARMDNTPSQARNIMGLTLTAAGVTPTGSMTSFTPYDNSGSSSISVNGSQGGVNWVGATNEMVVDGVSNRMGYNSGYYGLIPTQESVAEMKVVSNAYSAEYGRTTGGVITVATKSGTNQFHGELFEYNRTTALSANRFERNLAGQPILPVHFNTPGGMIGGPIKRNKLFFFFETQRLHSTSPSAKMGQVPTQAERGGDFSQTYYNLNGQAALQVIYDPLSAKLDPATGHFLRTPFTGNVIPSNRINVVAQKFWKYIPLPNSSGDSITRANNYTPANNGTARADLSEYMSHVDYNINDTSRVTFRYTRNNMNSYDVEFYPTAADPSGTGFPFTRANNNAVVDYTKTLSPTMVVDVRAGMERYFTAGVNQNRNKVTPADLGFSSTFVAQASPAFPIFNFGGSTLGSTNFSGAGTSSGNMQPDQINMIDGSIIKTTGRQTIKAGAMGRMERYYSVSAGNNAGSFGFSPTDTNLDPQVSAASSGNPVASFLLGVGSASIDINSSPARQNLSTALYIQDDINVTAKLKVNAGLRWDWNGGMTDRFNAMTGTFATGASSPLASAVAAAATASGANCPACSNLVGGLTFPGVNGLPRTVYDSSRTNFGPRLGAAYALNSRTVIRAGWGLFYGPVSFDPGSAGFSQTTNSTYLDSNYLPVNYIDNPFPTGVLQPTGSKKGLSTNIGNSVSYIDPHAREPRSQQFSFDLQREVGWNTLVTAGYVYNGGSRIAVNRNIDTLTAAQYALGASVLNASVANPFAGLAPGTSLNQAKVSQSTLLRPYPQFSGVSLNDAPIGDSAYHAAQFQLTKRYSAGLSLSVGYTISKHLGRFQYQNNADTFLEKSYDPYDMPQVLTINGAWELPFGSGKRLLGNVPGWANRIVGGWQVNGIARLEEGTPYQFNSDTIPVSGVNPNAPHQNLDQWVNPAAYVLQTDPYQLRRWSSIDGRVRYPMIHNFDLSAYKDFRITERVKFTFMNNWVNAFNTPQFWNASCSSKSSSCFGKIASYKSQTNLPRQIQLAGRITF